MITNYLKIQNNNFVNIFIRRRLQCGAKILFASDDFFAAAENMLQDTEPIFIAEKFTGLYIRGNVFFSQ